MTEVEHTDEFGDWWQTLNESVQAAIGAKVKLLETVGPGLGRPHADTLRGSRHSNMKELRVQCKGDPYRIFYCFDPRRCAILLIGGNKAGDNDWMERFLPIADQLYDVHIATLIAEGLLDSHGQVILKPK